MHRGKDAITFVVEHLLLCSEDLASMPYRLKAGETLLMQTSPCPIDPSADRFSGRPSGTTATRLNPGSSVKPSPLWCLAFLEDTLQ